MVAAWHANGESLACRRSIFLVIFLVDVLFVLWYGRGCWWCDGVGSRCCFGGFHDLDPISLHLVGRTMVGQHGRSPFVEGNVSHLLNSNARDPYAITALILVSHQVAHGPAVLQLPQLLSWKGNSRHTPEGTYVSHIRLYPVEMLIRRHASVRPCRRPIAQVLKCCHRFCPEARREIRVAQHRARAIGGHTDESFGDGTDELIRIPFPSQYSLILLATRSCCPFRSPSSRPRSRTERAPRISLSKGAPSLRVSNHPLVQNRTCSG
jgi:hypothetical protein